MKPKTALLAAVIMVTVGLGLWLLISPMIENREALSRQNDLLDSIAANIADNTSNEEIAITEADFNIASDEPIEPEEIPAEDETDIVPVLEYEPLDDSEFPDAVIGIGILTIEKIDLRLPVADGISEAGLRIAPGRVPETAVISEPGNAVIAGHRNYAYGEMFNRLDEIEIGDIIAYQARNGEVMRFEVFEIIEISPDDQIAFIQPEDDSIITLYTCTPVRVASHRLLVRARKI